MKVKTAETHQHFEDPFFYKEEDQYPVVSQRPTELVQPESVEKKTKTKRFGWAFFLAFTMMGIGITASTEIPMGVLGGMGIGFLFFVHPIHDRVISMLSGKKSQEDQQYLP